MFGVMRVDADGGVKGAVTGCHVNRFSTGVEIGANDDHFGDAGGNGAVDDLPPVVIKSLKIKMSVGVDHNAKWRSQPRPRLRLVNLRRVFIGCVGVSNFLKKVRSWD